MHITASCHYIICSACRIGQVLCGTRQVVSRWGEQVPTKVAISVKQIPTKLVYGVKALADGDDNKDLIVGDVFPKADSDDSSATKDSQ